jgi:exopolysaccharide biosynthesis polyprenyl glycosylphosphotransferase
MLGFTGRKTNLLYLAAIIVDFIVLLSADLLAFRLYLGPDFYNSRNFIDYSNIALYILAFKLTCLYIFQLYSKEKFRSNFVILVYIIKAMTASSIGMALMAYSLRADSIPRAVILVSWILSIGLLTFWRHFAKNTVEFFMGKDYFKSHLLIIGTSKAAEKIAVWLLNNGLINYKLVGFIKDEPAETRKELMGYPIIDAIENIKTIPKRYRIDHVFVTSSHLQFREVSRIFSAFRRKKEVTFCTTPDLYDEMISCDYLEEGRIKFFSPIPFQNIPLWYPPLKRFLDVFVSLLLLVLLFPLIVIIAAVIKLSSPGPVFYLSKRVGFMGKSFVMIKFRSMHARHSRARLERWAQAEDERITFVGKIMRRFRLDELPQLFNVLSGEMSLIGPRPETKYYVLNLLKEIPLYSERLNAKPGITGWAQVNFGYAGTIEESRKKLLFDIYYIQNQSLFLDLIIALKTVNIVISASGR